MIKKNIKIYVNNNMKRSIPPHTFHLPNWSSFFSGIAEYKVGANGNGNHLWDITYQEGFVVLWVGVVRFSWISRFASITRIKFSGKRRRHDSLLSDLLTRMCVKQQTNDSPAYSLCFNDPSVLGYITKQRPSEALSLTFMKVLHRNVSSYVQVCAYVSIYQTASTLQ